MRQYRSERNHITLVMSFESHVCGDAGQDVFVPRNINKSRSIPNCYWTIRYLVYFVTIKSRTDRRSSKNSTSSLAHINVDFRKQNRNFLTWN